MIDDLRRGLELMVRMRREMRNPTNWQRGLRYHGTEDLILQHGTVYRRATRRPPTHPIPKACFHQSYRLAARKGSKWIYVEGFATSPDAIGIPVLHAWLTTAETPGEAYDVAWTHPEADYIGIPFDPGFVKAMRKRLGQYSVLDAWQIGYPLLTGEIAVADVIWKNDLKGGPPID